MKNFLTAIVATLFLLTTVAHTEDAEEYHSRGIAYYNQQQYQQEIQEYNKVLQLNPNNADAYKSLEQYESALKDYNTAIQLNPNFAQTYFLRGLIYAELGDNAKVLVDVTRAKQLGYNG